MFSGLSIINKQQRCLLQVFTWEGCTVELATDPARPEVLDDVVGLACVLNVLQAGHVQASIFLPALKQCFERRYDSNETPMVEYLNVHGVLNSCRAGRLEGQTSDEPRVLVGIEQVFLAVLIAEPFPVYPLYDV